MAAMLEKLNAVFCPWNHKPENIADRLWQGTRGAPENFGPELRASHPCIRTNPVTGWKTLFAFGHHLERVEGLGDVENKFICEFLQRLISENHQIQARVRWNVDDLVIWDNRSVYHVSYISLYLSPPYLSCWMSAYVVSYKCPTYDYGGTGVRRANRVCGTGEIPYFDPNSVGRREALSI